MFYYLFDYLERTFQFPGASAFQYISFRAGMAMVFSLLITMVLAPRLGRFLRRLRWVETVRDLSLPGEKEKQKTPTMGGLLIICGVILPTLLFVKLDNIYVLCLILTVFWMGMIGFLDDYITIRNGNKSGLVAWVKVAGQGILGLSIALFFLYHPSVMIREFGIDGAYADTKALLTTIPFFKFNQLDYADLFAFLGNGYVLGYIFLVIFIVIGVSNGVNLTDGLDGLASGSSAIVGLVLAIFAYLSGNIIFSSYLNILYIPDLGEVVIFSAAFVGSCIGFLWYNSYPAKIFMGDTGSLVLGGVLAVLSMIVRKELLLPLLAGIFFMESVSVIIQVVYFKYTRRVYGVGRRVFLMAPLHHHFQKKGWHEVTIVTRFWIIGILLGIFSLVTIKLR